jgi:hypothetical protein
MDLQGWFTFSRVYDAIVKHVFQDNRSAFPSVLHFAECGVWKGRSLFYLAAKIAKQNEAHGDCVAVHAIDNFEMPDPDSIPAEDLPRRVAVEQLVKAGKTLHGVYKENLASFKYRALINTIFDDLVSAASRFKAPKLAMVMLDASHGYDATCRAIAAWKDKTHILVGHDISLNSVQGAVEDCIGFEGCDWYRIPECDCWIASPEHGMIAEFIAAEVNGDPQNAFVGIPTGAGDSMSAATANALVNASNARHNVSVRTMSGSILTCTFNSLYANALNMMDELNLKYFIMLHNDIGPIPEDWLDKLINLANEHDADILSVVSPIKSEMGLTSTAIDTDPYRPRRITMTEIQKLPGTFGAKDLPENQAHSKCGLLINTGVMLVNLHKAASRNLFFEFNDRIIRLKNKGKEEYVAEVEPEDWNFSRKANAAGLRVFATSEIPLLHVGTLPYSNMGGWGKMKTDEWNSRENVKRIRDMQIE